MGEQGAGRVRTARAHLATGAPFPATRLATSKNFFLRAPAGRQGRGRRVPGAVNAARARAWGGLQARAPLRRLGHLWRGRDRAGVGAQFPVRLDKVQRHGDVPRQAPRGGQAGPVVLFVLRARRHALSFLSSCALVTTGPRRCCRRAPQAVQTRMPGCAPLPRPPPPSPSALSLNACWTGGPSACRALSRERREGLRAGQYGAEWEALAVEHSRSTSSDSS
jgi:hypothetical protein